MKSISVVIPNYNGLSLLKENIPFVYAAIQTSRVTDFEIIVSDDASTDASVEFLKQKYPEIVIVENKINTGFAGNVNSGIRFARKELVFILNTDVRLSVGYFKSLLPYFEDRATFGVMGRIMSLDGEKHRDGAKYPELSFGSIVATKNYTSKDTTRLYSLFLSGANALIDREKLLEIGCFNELFNPYYFEDADLGLTAWRMGYKLYYEHDAVCYHPYCATIKHQPSEKVKRIAKRNKLIMHYLHLDGIELSYFMLLFILKMCFRLLIFDTFYRKVFLDFLSMQKSVKLEKEKYIKLRKKSLRDIKKTILNNIKGLDIVKF